VRSELALIEPRTRTQSFVSRGASIETVVRT
jgi:hypothetical protein